MAYKKSDLEAKALEAINDLKLVFIEDVCAKLPCTKETFYRQRLHESDAIKEAIERNKVDLKGGLRKKMYAAETPVAWIALYKLVGTDDEVDRLNGSRQKHDVTTNGEPLKVTFNLSGNASLKGDE